MTKNITNYFLLLLFPILISCCSDRPPKDEDLIQGLVNENQTGLEIKETDAKKSNEELIAEAAKTVYETGKDVIRNLKANDSIRFVNREQVYAYRIGLSIEDKGKVFEAYKNLSETESIYVLRQSKDEYYLVFYNGYSKQQLEDSLEIFKASLPSDLQNQIHIINLMQLCTNSKQKLKVGDNLTKRKEDVKIPCLTCDK